DRNRRRTRHGVDQTRAKRTARAERWKRGETVLRKRRWDGAGFRQLCREERRGPPMGPESRLGNTLERSPDSSGVARPLRGIPLEQPIDPYDQPSVEIRTCRAERRRMLG